VLLVVGATAAMSACELEKIAIPAPPKVLALHGVLSATAPSQVVLLERTLNGTISPSAPPFDIESPLGSDEGIAEGKAHMTLTAPDGKVVQATEDAAANFGGLGTGVYRFELSGSSLVRGAVYRLRVTTAAGEIMTAETSLPGGAAVDFAQSGTFDRSKDTMMVSWSAVAGARSYLVRIESPFGPRSFFTDSTHVRLTGDLRNVDLDAIPRVFIPGFPQAITVSAVDANYYDWFRTHNDPLTGQGVISRVTGGLGVFGSLVRLTFRDVEVTAPQSEPSAGRFDFTGTADDSASTPYLRLELYVESAASRSDQGDALSGNYQKRSTIALPGCPVCGVLGTVKDGHVELAMLRAWSASDTAEFFTGDLHGDTLMGRYRGAGGPVHFVRRP
jgi:hypothetical protein